MFIVAICLDCAVFTLIFRDEARQCTWSRIRWGVKPAPAARHANIFIVEEEEELEPEPMPENF